MHACVRACVPGVVGSSFLLFYLSSAKAIHAYRVDTKKSFPYLRNYAHKSQNIKICLISQKTLSFAQSAEDVNLFCQVSRVRVYIVVA